MPIKTLAPTSNILLIRLRRIGDLVMTTPAVTLLKNHFPGVSVTYLVEEPFRRLVEGNPNLEKVIAVPRGQKTRDFFSLIRSVRREKFDAILDFHGGPRASWLTFLSGAGLKVGYAIRGKGFLYDVRIPRGREGGHVHSVVNHANLVRALGAQFSDADIPPLFLPEAKPEEASRVADIVSEAGARGKARGKTVALHVGAGNRFRDWGVSNILGLVALLSRIPETKIFLIGGNDDQEIARTLLGSAHEAVTSLVGRLNLIEIRELISRVSLFVGPDSGPMHIAASTPTPIVAYFGPTLPEVFAPWRPSGGKTVILEKSLECRPCRQVQCATEDYRCLQTITPEEVFAASARFLKS